METEATPKRLRPFRPALWTVVMVPFFLLALLFATGNGLWLLGEWFTDCDAIRDMCRRTPLSPVQIVAVALVPLSSLVFGCFVFVGRTWRRRILAVALLLVPSAVLYAVILVFINL